MQHAIRRLQFQYSKQQPYTHIRIYIPGIVYLKLSSAYYVFPSPPAFLTQFLEVLKKESIKDLKKAFLKVADAGCDSLDDKLKKAEEEMRESLAKVQALPED